MVNIHQLTVFAAVVEHGSFTLAARRLFLTQPAVTAQVRQLRAFVGTELLIREGRTVVPTPAGTALYQYACEVLAATEALQHRLEVITSGEYDPAMVGAIFAYSTYVLPQLLARYQAEHPNVRLTLIAAPGPELLQRVRANRLDLAVLIAERPPQEVTVALLGAQERIIVESVERPISSGGRMTLQELAAKPFVAPRVVAERPTTALDRRLAEAGLPGRRIVMELTSWEGVSEAVRAGVGLAVTPHAAVVSAMERGELRSVAVEEFRDVEKVYLIQSPRRQAQDQPSAYRALVRYLIDELPTALRLGSTDT